MRAAAPEPTATRRRDPRTPKRARRRVGSPLPSRTGYTIRLPHFREQFVGVACLVEMIRPPRIDPRLLLARQPEHLFHRGERRRPIAAAARDLAEAEQRRLRHRSKRRRPLVRLARLVVLRLRLE